MEIICHDQPSKLDGDDIDVQLDPLLYKQNSNCTVRIKVSRRVLCPLLDPVAAEDAFIWKMGDLSTNLAMIDPD